MGTAEKLNSIINGKNAIKNAIQGKGVTVGDAIFAEYANKISNIETITGVDVSDTTAVSSDVISGKLFHTSNGNCEAGTLNLDAEKIMYGTTMANVSGTATQYDTAYSGDILNGRTAHARGSAVTGTIPLIGGSSYTPTANRQTISAGVYLSGNLYIEGDSNLVAENIKKDVSIFGVSGSYQGTGGSSSSTLNLASITAYTAYRQEMNLPYTVEVSGITVYTSDYDQTQDLTYLNGTYTVISDKEFEKVNHKRIYKHNSGNYYLYCYTEEYDSENISYYWCFSSNTSYYIYSAYFYNSSIGSTLTSGTYTFDSEYESYFTMSITLNVTAQNYPEIAQVLTGNPITGYNSSSAEWVKDTSSTLNFSTFVETPKINYIYVYKDNSLLGNAVDYNGGYYTGQLKYMDGGSLSFSSWETAVTNWNNLASKSSSYIATSKLYHDDGETTQIQNIASNNSVKMWGQIYFDAVGTWKLYCKNDDGIAVKIDTVSAYNGGVNDSPAQILTFNCQAIGWYDFTFYWQNGTGGQFYRIYLKSPTDTTYSELATTQVRAKVHD